MNDVRLILPMTALVLLTVTVALIMVTRRFGAARAGQVKVSDFRVNQFRDDAPRAMLQAGRNFSNLFETPVLFYAVCIAAMAAQLADSVLLGLAWAYVAVRAAHSAVHVGGNNVTHRLIVFVVSFVIVVSMWLYLATRAMGVAAG